MSDVDIWIDKHLYEDRVSIHLDREGAEYIATIMEEEFERSADAGAFEIARRIRARFRDLYA